MNDEEKIRAFENGVLDKIYLERPFYNYSPDIVIPYLLQTYGDTVRHREGLIKAGHNEIALNFYMSNMIHGISHCIRWIILQKTPKFSSTEGLSYRKIHELSTDFVAWGIEYHTIAQEFVTWSRHIKKAILETVLKSIENSVKADSNH